MTNEEKAKRLEEMARVQDHRAHTHHAQGNTHNEFGFEDMSKLSHDIADLAASDAALLRESAQIWREQEGVRWEDSERRCVALYKRHILICRKSLASADYYWDAMRITISAWPADGGSAPTLDAAKAAAVAWVDQQEGKQND